MRDVCQVSACLSCTVLDGSLLLPRTFVVLASVGPMPSWVRHVSGWVSQLKTSSACTDVICIVAGKQFTIWVYYPVYTPGRSQVHAEAL